ncbi:mandelate racemase/muconate lactonizing enzyme [Tanacetum coccineum]
MHVFKSQPAYSVYQLGKYQEPVNDEDDMIKFCEESGVPVALDETDDNLQENPLQMLARFTHNEIVVVVTRKIAVVSAAFETGISLSVYIQFSCFIDMQNEDICKIMNKEPPSPVAHGLGTYRWRKEDIITEPLSIRRGACSGFMEASVFNSGQTLINININRKSVV